MASNRFEDINALGITKTCVIIGKLSKACVPNASVSTGTSRVNTTFKSFFSQNFLNIFISSTSFAKIIATAYFLGKSIPFS